MGIFAKAKSVPIKGGLNQCMINSVLIKGMSSFTESPIQNQGFYMYIEEFQCMYLTNTIITIIIMVLDRCQMR